MKTYILTLSKTFMKGHPRFGEPTNFKEKFLSGEKIHTIRQGDYWRLVAQKVNSGIAALSVREWSGKPYKSKQVEIALLTKLSWQSFTVDDFGTMEICDSKTSKAVELDQLSANDGLETEDFLHWFNYPKAFKGGIVHFTSFNY